MTKVLVTGGGGQLGRALARARWPDGWQADVRASRALDLTDSTAIATAVAGGDYAAVVNAGAYTAVDRAESEAARAWQANAAGPAALGQACRAAHIPLIQVSTDYVFDGSGEVPWRPDSPVAPLNVYGASKLGGELAVRASGARHAIVRTSWVVSADGQNFVKTMLRLAGERDVLRVVDDQIGAPTAADDLAKALIAATVALAGGAPSGTHHFASAGETSWFGVARYILAESVRRGGPTARVEPISSAAFPTPARRPTNSRLDTTSFKQNFSVTPRLWQLALGDILDQLIGPAK